MEDLALDSPRAIRFGNEFVKRRYLIVPFYERRYRSETFDGLAIQPPHGRRQARQPCLAGFGNTLTQ
jgi:hypothetical protein